MTRRFASFGFALQAGAAFVALCSAAHAQQTWYVDNSAPLGGDGKSWTTAFKNPNGALDRSSAGDEIRVAQGRYLPDGGPGRTRFDREATFRMVDGVAIVGGFRGLSGFGSPDERDPHRFLTTLSGDLRSNDPRHFDDNSKHVVTFDAGVAATIDGVEIRDGNEPGESGAGVAIHGGHATLVGCTITANAAKDGGGVLVDGGSLVATGCAIDSNHADAGHGGAIEAKDADVTLDGCELALDSAKEGAALRFLGSGALVARDTRFLDGFADKGGAVVIESGDFARCVFNGGIANVESAAVRVVGTNGGRVTVRDSLLSHNEAAKGGAIHDTSSGGGPVVEVAGSTIVDNFVWNAPDGGGIRGEDPAAGSIVVKSSILWNNQDSVGHHDEADQLSAAAGAIAIDWSDVQGWTGGLGGSGNQGADPKFVFPFFGDYHLDMSSPCIDAGDPAFAITPESATDLDGAVRKLDGDLDRDDRVDLGCFEAANVRLSIFGIPRLGGVVTVRLDGTPNLPALLIVGVEPGFSTIPPLGAFLMDVTAPTTYATWPAAPSSVDLDIPGDLPLPAEYFVQAYVEDGRAGNLSNMVHLVITP